MGILLLSQGETETYTWHQQLNKKKTCFFPGNQVSLPMSSSNVNGGRPLAGYRCTQAAKMELDWSGGRSRFKWARKGQNSKTIRKKVYELCSSYPVDVFQPSLNIWVDMSDWGIIIPFLKLECNKNWLKSPLKSPEHLWRLWDDPVNTNQLVSHGFFWSGLWHWVN